MSRPLLLTFLILAAIASTGCQGFQRMHNERVARRRDAAQANADRVAKAPSEAADSLARAQLLQSQGLDSVALAEFEKAIAINPKLTNAYLGIGQIHQKQGDLPKAEQAFHRATQVEPTNFDAQYNHGLVLQLLNRI